MPICTTRNSRYSHGFCQRNYRPVNIPINMAIAIGLANILENVDPCQSGFGIIGLTSLGSVISVLTLGILTRIL